MKDEKIKSFQDPEINLLANKLVSQTYSYANKFSNTEEVSLNKYLAHSAISNSEYVTKSMRVFPKKEFIHRLKLFRGSIEEVLHYNFIAKDLWNLYSSIYESLVKLTAIPDKKSTHLLHN